MIDPYLVKLLKSMTNCNIFQLLYEYRCNASFFARTASKIFRFSRFLYTPQQIILFVYLLYFLSSTPRPYSLSIPLFSPTLWRENYSFPGVLSLSTACTSARFNVPRKRERRRGQVSGSPSSCCCCCAWIHQGRSVRARRNL